MRQPAARKPNPELKFSTKSRFEYLRGFSARKEERKRKGNRKNLRKQLLEKKEEQNLYKTHIQQEYKKAVDAVKHNTRLGQSSQPIVSETVEVVQTPIIDESVTVFEQNDKSDPFGNVSVHITALESSNFATLARMDDEEIVPPKPKAMVTSPGGKKTGGKKAAKPFRAKSKKPKNGKSFGKSMKKTKNSKKVRPGQK